MAPLTRTQVSHLVMVFVRIGPGQSSESADRSHELSAVFASEFISGSKFLSLSASLNAMALSAIALVSASRSLQWFVKNREHPVQLKWIHML